jgi:hypothetical protein
LVSVFFVLVGVILQTISREQLKVSGLNPVEPLYITISVCDGFHSICEGK